MPYCHIRILGLRIPPNNKIKVMKVKNMNTKKTNFQGIELDEAKDFKYLG